MRQLPHWCITDNHPAFYDTESATAIEQTAKLYGAMRELIEEYNKMVENLTNEIQRFETETTVNWEEFKLGMVQQFEDFASVVEQKIMLQDKSIEEVVKSIPEICKQTVNKAIADGRITVGVNYDSTTENINIAVTGGV